MSVSCLQKGKSDIVYDKNCLFINNLINCYPKIQSSLFPGGIEIFIEASVIDSAQSSFL